MLDPAGCGLPKSVDPAGKVMLSGWSANSVRMTATLHFSIVGSSAGFDQSVPGTSW
jgi:hypothetical protein